MSTATGEKQRKAANEAGELLSGGRNASVVHIGSGELHVAKAGRPKSTEIAGFQCAHKTAERGDIAPGGDQPSLPT
jgi:hypothetical protein